MKFDGVVFPGQGSQRKQMAADFHDQFPESRATFEQASEALSFDVREICNSDDESRLNLTEYAQPCILTAEIAMYRALQNHFQLSPRFFGGHSLGEYSALVAAEVIPFESAVKLVHLRGQLMQRAIPAGNGGMAAIIMEALPLSQVEQLAKASDIDIANDNSPNQVVLSGEKNKLENLCEQLASQYQLQGIRIVPLNVSAPFHSRYMVEIESKFKNILEGLKETFNPTRLNQVVSNVSGRFHVESISELINSLSSQISGRVRWQDNMILLHQNTAGLLEVGPGRPLSGFFKTLGIPVSSIVDLRTAQRAFPHVEKIGQQII